MSRLRFSGRLGHQEAWTGRVGDDAPGAMVLDEDRITAVRILHATGITARVERHRARRRRTGRRPRPRRRLFAVNHRERLWSRAEAVEVLARLLLYADIVFADAAHITGTNLVVDGDWTVKKEFK
ncbi:hypothetical protein [Streptomyces sp. NPDC018711]|uniref:hypothetical protein n=1 Tax=Streptomyces sp. NPDC018711 TaxID=3365052 RepID=UPI0037ACC110